MAQPDPEELVPSANSPQLLTQLLELVARGVRSPRALQEGLGVDPRTVRYYTRAGEWLGLLDGEETASLTPLGLEYVYAGAQRAKVYAAAAWSVPLVRELMAGRTDLPATDEIAVAIARAHPTLAPSTARRRASAVRSLIEPAVHHRGPRARPQVQLDLPIAPRARTLAPPPAAVQGGEHDPALYRFVLGALVDHGELSLGHLRALLDRAGADDAPLGGYVELALSRGDAARLGERLVATREAVRWQDLAESTPSIVLSDPGYRRWIADLRAGDAVSAARRRGVARRYGAWDRRLFGEIATAETLDALLGRLLLERGLDAWPLRGAAGDPISVREAPFLDTWRDAGLPVAMPPCLGELRGGVAAINRLLRQARPGAERVALPSPVDPVVAVHGGLLHPGERPIRAVPDARSLRLRLVSRSPYVAMTVALLAGHRADPRLELVRRDAGWVVQHRRRAHGPLLEVLDELATRRGWIPCRRARGGLSAADLVDVLVAAGLAVVIGARAVMDEAFFRALRDEPEEGELRDALDGLRDAVLAHLGALGPAAAAAGDDEEAP